MRKLNRKHLLVTALVVVGVGAFIFIPYWIGSTHYITTLGEQINLDKVDPFIIPVSTWILGLLKILITVVTVMLVGLIITGIPLAFDWLFPKQGSEK